ncbi:MAG: hypothetical protein CVT95_06135, partial [Bacteroidetes bacterium HGW-Bacteroidetes-12]
TVKHIDNPLIHLGLEIASIFMDKTKQGIENLIEIIKLNKIEKDFFDDVRLLNYFHNINKLKLNLIFKFLYSLFSNPILKHLTHSKKPSLILFDTYKLLYINQLNK